MTVKEIIKEYLLKNGFDGLVNQGECGCKIDDLMLCNEECSMCEPGYLHPGDEEFDYYINVEKETKND